jgi:hypothetical protein
MRTSAQLSSGKKGASLVEAIIAVGVLAVAVPLVFATMAESGESGLSAQAETRSSWIVPACMEELQLAMKGTSMHIGELTPTKDFPAAGGIVALAFAGEGGVLGKVEPSAYESGLREINGRPVRYIASMSGSLPKQFNDENPQCLTVVITIEYPAAAPAAKRQKIDFHTRLP